FIAGIERLESFVKVLEEPKASPVEGSTIIDTVEDSRLSLQHLTLQTPNYQRTLVKNVSIELQPGEGLLIVGVSGSGKSSILRAIAGLWNSGTGTIYRPKLEEILFLPQHPYMILGSLRDQLLYPRTDLNISDEIIYRVLNQVNLPKLAEIFGGLDTVEDWENMLSMGEQQRVAFARLLLTQPRYAILDEATSALDVQNEQSLYQHLQSLSTTYVSVGHRPTLLQYHHQVLEVMGDETWRVTSAQDYKFMPIH
ncbi:MAG: ATP-binding cassette domain-containing protein, partial [Okeania sp. SIO2H7]|nr:ATP-binding cassette domain-containing protein [Okeania sp. SIO2H7]